MSDSKHGFYNIDEKKWILTKRACFDRGDVEIIAGDPQASFQQIEHTISMFVKQQCTPIIMGGDHAITFPVLKVLSNVYSDITIIHFDAHMDYY